MSLFRILALAIAWVVLTRQLTFLNVLLGLALATLLVRKTCGSGRESEAGEAACDLRARVLAAAGSRVLTHPLRALELVVFFLYELVLSNVRMALVVLRPRMRVAPMILEVQIDAESDEELALLSDLVTLTPGTLTMDVADDGRALLVHVLTGEDPDEVRHHIRHRLGRRVRRLFA